MTTQNPIFRFTSFLSWSLLFVLGASAPAIASPSDAASALSIALDETYRGAGLAAGEPDCFRLEIPSAGLLMLDLAVPGGAEAEPRLALLGSGCGTAAARLSMVEQSATHLISLSTAAQDLLVCVGAQDPRRRLGDYKLRSAFHGVEPGCAIDKSTDPEPIETEPEGQRTCLLPESSTDPEPIETEPEGLHAGLPPEKSTDPEPIAEFRLRAFGATEPEGLYACLFPEHSTDPEPIETEPEGLRAGLLPEKSTDPEPIETEPEGLRGRGPFEALCQAGELDDHADALPCATPLALGRPASGELDNGWGDDHDLFRFELTAARTVRIETSGEADTFGGLYDRHGQRLAAAADGGEGANFRLVKTLAPGLYFVRVEAEGWTEGAYSLSAELLESSW